MISHHNHHLGCNLGSPMWWTTPVSAIISVRTRLCSPLQFRLRTATLSLSISSDPKPAVSPRSWNEDSPVAGGLSLFLSGWLSIQWALVVHESPFNREVPHRCSRQRWGFLTGADDEVQPCGLTFRTPSSRAGIRSIVSAVTHFSHPQPVEKVFLVFSMRLTPTAPRASPKPQMPF